MIGTAFAYAAAVLCIYAMLWNLQKLRTPTIFSFF